MTEWGRTWPWAHSPCPSFRLLSSYLRFIIPFFFLFFFSPHGPFLSHAHLETSDSSITILIRCFLYKSAAWFIHTVLWSLTSIEPLLTPCSDGEMQDALKPLGISVKGKKREGWIVTEHNEKLVGKEVCFYQILCQLRLLFCRLIGDPGCFPL